MMRKVLEWLAGATVMFAFAVLLAFVFINFMLGCETWDESYWTEYNSCLTPTMIWEGVTNHE